MSLLCSESVKEKLVDELLFSGELVADGRLKESDSLEHALYFLSNYAHHNNDKFDRDYTHLEVVPDWAPHSFCFNIWVLSREDNPKKITADSWTAREYPELIGYTHYFTGGIIFHGAHDNGGDGSMSTLSVCLTPVNGWSVHT